MKRNMSRIFYGMGSVFYSKGSALLITDECPIVCLFLLSGEQNESYFLGDGFVLYRMDFMLD
jgi:hypothetical protein